MNFENSSLKTHQHVHSCHLLIMINNLLTCVPNSHGEPTNRQSQIAISATTADSNNDQTDESMMEEQTTTNINDNRKKNPTDYGEKLFVHYTHEQRLNTLKRDMHHVYNDTFQHTPAMDLNLIVGSRNRRDAKHELIRKRPNKSLLQNKAKPSKY